jgi:integrase
MKPNPHGNGSGKFEIGQQDMGGWVRLSRGWLSLKMQRLRRRLALPNGVTLYGLRHRYGLMGIKNGVNLKLLSLCMGHARTQMTEHYIAEAGLTAQVQQAAWQVAYGATLVLTSATPAASPLASSP